MIKGDARSLDYRWCRMGSEGIWEFNGFGVLGA